MAGTAIVMLQFETLKSPDPKKFRDLVKRKRGASDDYPIITSYDLGG
jgi:hypothetical protein